MRRFADTGAALDESMRRFAETGVALIGTGFIGAGQLGDSRIRVDHFVATA